MNSAAQGDRPAVDRSWRDGSLQIPDIELPTRSRGRQSAPSPDWKSAPTDVGGYGSRTSAADLPSGTWEGYHGACTDLRE